MYYTLTRLPVALSLLLFVLFFGSSLVSAQDEEYAAPVRYTEARQHTLRPTIKLPGEKWPDNHSFVIEDMGVFTSLQKGVPFGMT